MGCNSCIKGVLVKPTIIDQGSNGFSRRNFLNLALAASATAACGTIFSESLLARKHGGPFPKDAICIDSNENPLGPCQAAREALAEVIPNGGRYSDWLTDDLVQAFAASEGLPADHVQCYPGSSEPLHYSVLAFTSPTKTYVTADPGYEAGMHAAEISAARVVKVPLTRTYAHDVKAMLAKAPDGGLFYICTPNNPTGTLTPHSDIEYLVEHKPQGSVVMVDEAYIHFADGAATAMDLVKAGKDVIVLRTFSKIYGMAGLRCGFAIARPDLLQKIRNYQGWNAMPITAIVAASASLKDLNLVPERKRINATTRQQVFDWLHSNGYWFIPSQSNCFMLDTKRDGKLAIAALQEKDIYVGRIWPIMPTYVRITVGTPMEMDRFQTAFAQVMKGAVMGKLMRPSKYADGMDTNGYEFA
jgi:histidinol-phosphate aminotransferase